MMVRLVKGAYWDTEVKRAQERGLADYPVFTRKAATDLCYLACARRLLAARAPPLSAVRQPQRADRRHHPRDGRRHGRLRVPAPAWHGRGALRGGVGERGRPCRIYAPVGGHRELLAYLVRRLLENGANSSFVAIAGDRAVPVDSCSPGPPRRSRAARGRATARIPLPADLYAPSRRNSKGMEFGHRRELDALRRRDRPRRVPRSMLAR